MPPHEARSRNVFPRQCEQSPTRGDLSHKCCPCLSTLDLYPSTTMAAALCNKVSLRTSRPTVAKRAGTSIGAGLAGSIVSSCSADRSDSSCSSAHLAAQALPCIVVH